MSGAPVFLSVVVPVFRTAWALPELVRRIDAAVGGPGWRYEIVLVDDASPDDPRGVVAALAANRRPGAGEIRLLRSAENRGQHRSVLEGMAASRGAWVAVLDGDLQDPPEALPRLVEHALGGVGPDGEPRFDAVFAARVNRYQPWSRMITSRLFKRVLARACDLPAGSGMFFVASRRLAAQLATDDPRPFVVAMVGLAGLPVSSIPVDRARRPEGRSAYSEWRRLRAGISALAFVRRRRQAAQPEAPRPWRTPATLAGLSAALFVLVSLAGLERRVFDVGDEGFRWILSRAWADGVDLFATYRLHYVPGQYVYFGTLLRTFGRSLDVLRSADAFLGAAGVGAISWAVARIAPLPLAVAAAGATALLAVPGHATLASALVFLVALGLARRRAGAGTGPPPGWIFAVAALGGVLAGWREDSAVLALALAGLGVALRRRPSDLLRWLAPGALAGFAPWVVLFAARGQAAGLLDHVGHRLRFLVERLGAPLGSGWRWPDDPLASSWSLASALFPLLAAVPPAVYLAVLGHQAFRRRRGLAVSWTAVAAALVGAAYLPQFLWERPDLTHLRAHLHLLVGVAAVAAATSRGLPARGGRLTTAAALALAGAALLGLGYEAYRAAPVEAAARYPSRAGAAIGARVPVPPPPWAGRLGPRGGSDEAGALLVLGWGPGWYALEGGRPATRFLYTGPRALRRPGAAAELLADLEDPRVHWLLVGPHATPDAPSIEARARELFVPTERWRTWRLWERRDER